MLIARGLPDEDLAPCVGFLHHVFMGPPPAQPPGLRVQQVAAPNAVYKRRRGLLLLLLLLRLAVLLLLLLHLLLLLPLLV